MWQLILIKKLEVPMFLYGAAHREGRSLDLIRIDLGYFKPNSIGNWGAGELGFQNLPVKPDEGPDRVSLGKGVEFGALRWIDNYKVPVNSNDILAVSKISKMISGRGGGLQSVQAMALVHGEISIEVACNLLDPKRVNGEQVQHKFEELAVKGGLSVGEGYFTDLSQDEIIRKYLLGLRCFSMRSYSQRSGIKMKPNVLALSFLVSPPHPRHGWLLPGLPRLIRGMSSLSYCVKSGSVCVEVAKVVEVIRGEVNDVEPRLNWMKLTLSWALVHKVLLARNSVGISALCFFYWVLAKDLSFAADDRINNLMNDNLGRSHDYGTMLVMLKELSLRRHCVTEDAFKFLTFGSFDSITDYVRRVVDVLNLAGGSCCNSGIYSLIKLLCDLGSFHLAVHVMEKTARRTSYFNVLIAAKCPRGSFQGARDLFEEMRKFDCGPSTKSYNYLLGSLLKNDMASEACELLESMGGFGYHPDSITFEVVAFHACRLKRMDYAVDFLQKMLSDGIMPRFTTHSAFINGYFRSGWTGGDAHEYVIDMSERDKSSANMNYSLLANLSWKAGRFVEAGAFLFDTMEKNLQPNFSNKRSM